MFGPHTPMPRALPSDNSRNCFVKPMNLPDFLILLCPSAAQLTRRKAPTAFLCMRKLTTLATG